MKIFNNFVIKIIFIQDAKNNNGDTFESLLEDQTLTEIVNPIRYTKLTCLAARVIQKHEIKYKNEVPKFLYKFIELH